MLKRLAEILVPLLVPFLLEEFEKILKADINGDGFINGKKISKK